MKVFVTGATGFVGSEIVAQLHAAGHETHILARDPVSSRVKALETLAGVKVHEGDIVKSGPWEEALQHVEAVIHLVGIIAEVGDRTFENVHLRGTENVVHAAARAKVQRYVHMSALGTRPNALSKYQQTKWNAEEVVRASGLKYTIFRPSLIYGPGDHFVNMFAKMIRCSPVLPVLGGGRAKFQPISSYHVGKAFVGALTEPAAIGKTYDLCGCETLTLPRMLDDILAVMKRRRSKLRIGSDAASSLAVFLEKFYAQVLKKAPPLNRDQLVMLSEDNVGDGQPAMDIFGLECEPFRTGIQYVA